MIDTNIITSKVGSQRYPQEEKDSPKVPLKHLLQRLPCVLIQDLVRNPTQL